MASRGLLAFAALLATVLSVWAEEPAIQMVVSPGTLVKAGERLSITCLAQNFRGRVAKLFKYQPQAGARVALFTNDKIEDAYANVQRFSHSHNMTHGQDTMAFGFYFVIDGALAEDTGTYTCGFTNSNTEDSLRIDVLEPPANIELFIGDAEAEISIDQDGQEVELMAGERREVRCHVTGGNPAPSIKVMAGERDLTDKFNVNTRTTEHPNPAGLDGMFRPEADVSVVTKNPLGLKTDYSLNGQEVGCYAYVQDQQEPAISRYFIARFQGVKPEFVKCPASVMAMTYQKDVNITCTIVASPEATMSKFTWMTKSNDTVTLKVGKQNGHYSGKLEEVNGRVALTLNIDKVMPQTFRKYTFVAENELGSSQFTVDFIKDPSDPWIDGGASTMALSASLLTLLVAIQMYLHL